jgi:hypothetical protein
MFELLHRRVLLSTWVAAKVLPQERANLGLLAEVREHHLEAVRQGRPEVDSPASRELLAQINQTKQS